MMPFAPPLVFNRAKKRMQMGLHPAVVAAVNQAVDPTYAQQIQAYNQRKGRIDLGTSVNKGPTGHVGNIEAAQTRVGERYRTLIERGPGNKIHEMHVYGSGPDRQVMAFNRAPTAEYNSRLQALMSQQKTIPSVSQHLSNSATAEDKLLAMAARRVAMGNLPQYRVGDKRKFSRVPGLLQRS